MQTSQSTESKKIPNPVEEDLVDRDKDVFDPVLSFDTSVLYQQEKQGFQDLVDHYYAWESDLAKFIVPQVYHFPEFIVWCAENYIPTKRAIISKVGSVLIELNAQTINEMMRWSINPDSEPLNELVATKSFRELESKDRVSLLQSYLCTNLDVPGDNVVIQTNLFPETSQKIISMISMILGKVNDLTVDEFVLGIMVSIFPITTKPITKFNYAQFIADQIHYQLSEFETLRSFRYQSYLVHLFLFTQAFHFTHLGLKVEDDLGNPSSVSHWTSVIIKKPLNVEFSQYVDQFMSKAYQIIYNQDPPRIFPECKKLLQLSPDIRVGDWYVFEHYTEIRIYGCQLAPFRLPVFMTPMIFSLEYIRQRLNSDEIHFVPNKYKVNFKLKKEVGPFIVNTRSTL
jgi:hypothetical protein